MTIGNDVSDDLSPADSPSLAAAPAESPATGYLHPLYCQSLSEFGKPRLLSESKAWVLERPIRNPDTDAMGCYPLFTCQDWSRLHADLENIENTLVSLAVVTDPFGEYDQAYLQQCFPDVAIPFKDHYVVDLSRPVDTFVNAHHRRNARKAARAVSVEKCAVPAAYLDDWVGLYRELVARHHVKGIAAFSRESFDLQLRVPGIVAFRAIRDDVTVGMLLWYTQGTRACYHLGAYSPTGYEVRASFALFSFSLDYFAARNFEWLNLGAGAGTTVDSGSGLNRFKQGWSTETRTAYFCGRVFDRPKYEELVRARNGPPTTYFPAYRAGEFS